MPTTWIDFKELRGKLDFSAILKHYGVELRIKRGDQHQGFCPLPAHQGKRKSPSFSANLNRKIFHCFGCSRRGNCIDFACLMEGLNPDEPGDIRKAALILQERFVGHADAPTTCPPGQKASSLTGQEGKVVAATKDLPTVINAPLDFELKGLDPAHPYLASRGLTTETISHFGLGFCSKGLMKDRIAIPLHDQHGKLIGYAGRLVDDQRIDDENPKYRLPGSREREGKLYKFEKSRFLYNAFQIARPVAELIVVEGFPSVWWLWQQGFANVVALMGADCSGDQARLICELVAPGGCVCILTDGDEAGARCAVSGFTQIAPFRRVRWAKLCDGKQPTDLVPEELRTLLS